MAVARAASLKPLNERIINVIQRALVIGGGIAGMNSALDLARQGFDVTLVEKEPELGGFSRRLYHTIEGSDIPAYLKKLTAEVIGEKKIEVLTGAQISTFGGYKGNFKTTILVGSGREKRTVDHGVIVVATGATEYRPKEFLYGEDERVVTQVELADLLEKMGAANLSSVVMIQCVGSRNDENPECSRICCQNAVKNALHIKKLNPETQVVVLYRDIRTYGLLEEYYRTAREKGVLFIRFDRETPPDVKKDANGLTVTVKDHVLGRDIQIKPDLLALSAGMRAEDTTALSGILKLNRNPEGYFMEAHVKLRPVDMPGDGIFLCGTAHAPKLISETISQAHAAASRATSFLALGKIKLSAITAQVDTDHCVRCLTCVRSCPFGVPVFNEKEHVIVIDEAMCHGCGVCAGICPRKAIRLNFYEDDQILCKIDSLLAEGM
ncbi:MAG: FAD-dependent oxidoreductase [Desulfobacterales bacterium]|nr:FAD-dependent oxidoreductase [Desulfobacterales bacterium]